MISLMNSGNSQLKCQQECNEQHGNARSNHDIRASLAVTKGFNTALGASLADLCEAVQQLLDMDDSDAKSGQLQRVALLEEDCRFCMSRINRSIEQLGTRLEADARFGQQSVNDGSRDVA